MTRLRCCAAGVLLLLVAAGLRFFDLAADPSPRMALAFLSDEGWWAHSARNHYLFGTWTLGDWRQGILLAPLHTFLLRASFELFGLGLVPARLVSAAAGLATVAAAGWLLAQTTGRRVALWGMAILAVDYFAVSYSRVALVDALPALLMTLSAALAAHGQRRSLLRDFAAGAVATLALFAKLNAATFLVAAVAAFGAWAWIHDRRLLDRFAAGAGRALPFAAGAAALLAVWALALVAPHAEAWRFEMSRVRAENWFPVGFAYLLNGFAIGIVEDSSGRLRLGDFLAQSLLPASLALLWFVQAAWQALRDGALAVARQLTFAELFALSWILFQLAAMATTAHAAPRRYVWLVVPCALLGAHAIASRSIASQRLADLLPEAPTRWRSAACGAVLGAALAVFLRGPIANALPSALTELKVGTEPGLTAGSLCFLATALAITTGALLGALLARVRIRSSPTVGGVGAAFAALSLLVTGSYYASDAAHRTHGLREASAKLRALIGEEAVVAGNLSDTLLLSSPHRTLVLLDRTASGHGIYGVAHLEEARPTHLLLEGALDQQAVEEHLRRLLGPSPNLAAGPMWEVPLGLRRPSGEGAFSSVTLVRLTDPARL